MQITIIYQLEDGQQHAPTTFSNLDDFANHVDVYFNRIPYDIRGMIGFHYEDGISQVFEAGPLNIPSNKNDITKYFAQVFEYNRKLALSL